MVQILCCKISYIIANFEKSDLYLLQNRAEYGKVVETIKFMGRGYMMLRLDGGM